MMRFVLSIIEARAAGCGICTWLHVHSQVSCVNWERKEGLGLWKVPCFISLSSSCKEKECGRRQDGPLDWNRNTSLLHRNREKADRSGRWLACIEQHTHPAPTFSQFSPLAAIPIAKSSQCLLATMPKTRERAEGVFLAEAFSKVLSSHEAA